MFKEKKVLLPQSQARLGCFYQCLASFIKSYILINIKRTPHSFGETNETELHYLPPAQEKSQLLYKCACLCALPKLTHIVACYISQG